MHSNTANEGARTAPSTTITTPARTASLFVAGSLLAAPFIAGCEVEVGGNPLTAPDAGFVDVGFPDSGLGDNDGGFDPFAKYPEGPFGTVNGTTIENLVFAGYFAQDAKTGPTSAFSTLIDFQQVRRLGNYRYMLINVAAEWCSGCRVEAQLLPSRFLDWG